MSVLYYYAFADSVVVRRTVVYEYVNVKTSLCSFFSVQRFKEII